MAARHILCGLALILLLATSGCVIEQTRSLAGLSATFYPSYNETIRINFSAVKPAMAALGFAVKPYPSEWNPAGPAYDNGAEISRKADLVFHIACWTLGGSGNAAASGYYNATRGQYTTEKQVDAAKNYVKADMAIIAGGLNLTVDWSALMWSVDFGP